MDEFSSVPLPWSQAITEKRYTSSGSRISLKRLAEISGNSFDSIKQWSKDDQWVEKRRQFQQNLADEVEAEVFSTLKKNLSNQLCNVLIDHWQSAKRSRSIFDKRFAVELAAVERVEEQLESGEVDEQALLNHHRSIDLRGLAVAANSLKDLFQAERQALGLQYFQDLESAAAALEKFGFVILEKDVYDQWIANSDIETSMIAAAIEEES